MLKHKAPGPVKARVVGSLAAYSLVSVIIFIFFGAVALLLSLELGAEPWFAIIMGIAVGTLSFCALRCVLDEDAYDSPNTVSYVMLAGVLSFIGIILTYITLGVWPFGEHSVLIIDMHHQYVAFFSLLRDKLLSGGSLLYNTNAGLGSGYLPLFAYYSSSPFNILMLLFPRDMLTEAIALATVLKITAAGVTFAIMARFVFKRNDYTIVIGGVAYSMMSFFIGHSWNLMWLDPIILLPLIILGFELLLRRGKPALYCITLALAMITNYYITYMICLFIVLYFIAFVICESKGMSLTDQLRRLGRVIASSLVGIGISAALIIPTAIYLGQTSGAEDSFARDLNSNFNIFSIFHRMLFSASPSMRGDSLPNVYCSVLAVFLLVLFLVCKGISLRRRIAFGGIVGFLILSSSVNWLNFAWHGFHFPNDLPYRFSFLISFAMLYAAMMVLSELKSVTLRNVLTAFAVTAALLIGEECFGDPTSDFIMIYVSLLFFAIYAVILGLGAAGKIRRSLVCSLLLVFVFTEVVANASVEIQALDSKEYFTNRADFTGDYEVVTEAFSKIAEFGDTQYREELLPRKTCNDPSLFGYNGITVFASSNRKSVTTMMGKLGYGVNGVNSYLYNNFVPFTDSLLGVKYVVLGHELSSHPQLELVDSVSAPSVSSIGEEITENRYIYRNRLALPKAFMVRNDVISWEWEGLNPFVVQNSLARNAAGSGDIYELNYVDPNNAEQFNCTTTFTDSYFNCSMGSSAGYASFTASYTTARAGQVYAYIDCRAAEATSISYGSNTWNSQPNEPHIIDLGYLPEGAVVNVSVNTDMSCGGNIFLATLNEDELNAAISAFSSQQLQFETCEETEITGTVTAAQDGIMFTSIPYDAGWRVELDGERVKTYVLADSLLCFSVPAGTHSVKMTYWPSGLTAGIIISIISILALVLMMNPKWCGKLFAPITRARAAKAAQRSSVRLAWESEDADGFEQGDINDFLGDSDEIPDEEPPQDGDTLS